jgi:hypothetical protein
MVGQNKSVKRWFMEVIITLLLLCGIYIVLHFFHKGEVYNELTNAEITDINLLLNNNIAFPTDTISNEIQLSAYSSENKNYLKEGLTSDQSHRIRLTNKSTQIDSLKKLVLTYVFSKYPPLSQRDSIYTANYLAKFDKVTFAVIVSQYPYKCKSFFWLIDGWAYLEILFWSLFGLICSLLYNVSEAIVAKHGKFNENELPVHWAKFFYTPFIALVIYLAMDILTLDKDINVSQYGNGLIVFSFILGFFSRRAIDLLEKIKDIILPGKDRTSKSGSETAEEIATPEIIEEALKEKGEEWVNSFPNVTGFSIRSKITAGKDTGMDALLFKVTKKENSLEFGQIPEYITYERKSDGRKYQIMTDVLEENIPKPHVSKKDSSPFELGISISRELDNENTGTIGLLLSRMGEKDKRFIISCYHVFCAPELKMNNKKFISTDKSCSLRCASFEDDGTNIIGWVLNGQLNTESDFAIAELKHDVQFTNKFYLPTNNSIIPTGFISIIREDKNKKVKMCGRTSEYKEGLIKSHYSTQTIDYGNNITQYLKGLVEITRISKGGDSGAAVILDNNKVIGLVVGGNEESTYVLPVFDFIDNNEYKLA